MSKARKLTAILVFLLLVPVISARASADTKFIAHLSGDEEVPAKDTNAQGQAIFRLLDADTMYYKLIVSRTETDIFAAHIHRAPRGFNAPPEIDLYPVNSTGAEHGVIAEGTFTITPDLLEAMRAGNTYVNVHTTQYRSGEIRGQIETPSS